MIKYLGSKRTLIPALGQIARAASHTMGARTAVDLFAGTTRVAQEFKRQGLNVSACDLATYSHVLAQCYISTDARAHNIAEVCSALDYLAHLPGVPGYFTETFCEKSRFFQPHNGARIDVIRQTIEHDFKDSWLYPVLLTALMEAADRVDSTTGVQMAYLKNWAPRSYNELELRVPELLDGGGKAYLGDSMMLIDELEKTDLMYLDPPYNQHRYFTNYHIWETLVRWDKPEVYGVACKRVDAREEETKSVFNKKREMKDAFFALLARAALKAGALVVSYNNEAWISSEEMLECLGSLGYEDVLALDFDYKRYVGAQIGVYNSAGKKVGNPTHLRNLEHVFVAGPRELTATLVK